MALIEAYCLLDFVIPIIHGLHPLPICLGILNYSLQSSSFVEEQTSVHLLFYHSQMNLIFKKKKEEEDQI